METERLDHEPGWWSWRSVLLGHFFLVFTTVGPREPPCSRLWVCWRCDIFRKGRRWIQRPQPSTKILPAPNFALVHVFGQNSPTPWANTGRCGAKGSISFIFNLHLFQWPACPTCPTSRAKFTSKFDFVAPPLPETELLNFRQIFLRWSLPFLVNLTHSQFADRIFHDAFSVTDMRTNRRGILEAGLDHWRSGCCEPQVNERLHQASKAQRFTLIYKITHVFIATTNAWTWHEQNICDSWESKPFTMQHFWLRTAPTATCSWPERRGRLSIES